jgi:hypothetical protein
MILNIYITIKIIYSFRVGKKFFCCGGSKYFMVYNKAEIKNKKKQKKNNFFSVFNKKSIKNEMT